MWRLGPVLLGSIAVGSIVGACTNEQSPPVAPDIESGPLEVTARNILHVPRDFGNIQAAVDAASPGDIIQVQAGVYAEHVVVETSGIRLHAQGRVVIDGTASLLDGTGIGIQVLGTSASPVTGVEIDGFEVQNFEQGIRLDWVQGSRLHRNRSHDNNAIFIPIGLSAGIFLSSSSFNVLTNNETHDNGHDGIQLVASSGNLIRGNFTHDNGAQTAPANFGCGVNLLGAGNDANEVVANRVVNNHWGILLAGGPVGNEVAENQIHGHFRAGIATLAEATNGNVIVQNDARGNGLGDVAPSTTFDLFDAPPVNNIWERNKGTANF